MLNDREAEHRKSIIHWNAAHADYPREGSRAWRAPSAAVAAGYWGPSQERSAPQMLQDSAARHMGSPNEASDKWRSSRTSWRPPAPINHPQPCLKPLESTGSMGKPLDSDSWALEWKTAVCPTDPISTSPYEGYAEQQDSATLCNEHVVYSCVDCGHAALSSSASGKVLSYIHTSTCLD